MAGAAAPLILSHWYKLIENLQASPMEFYAATEAALERRQLPDVELSRVDWHEAGAFSVKREYLRVGRKRLVFDVCGAPFGNGFFVSWWLGELGSPYGPAALLLLLIGLMALLAVFVKIFGAFLGFVLTVVGAPVLFWLFARYVVGQVEGWDDALAAMPLVGGLYQRWFRPATYYKIDTALMFQSAVHAAVQEVVDDMTKAKGLRALTELERRPILREFFQR